MVRRRRGERGQTIILVAVSMLVLLALSALAIDVVTLYVSHSEAQRAADAAAMAGAKVFVSSGYTSAPSTFLGTPPCNGSTGLADLQAQASVVQNLIGGVAPTITTSCNLGNPTNPQITVTVQRTGLPIFFSRIWGASSPTATATATAEAYNPSGGPATIIASGVKPWLLPNCPPSTLGPPNTAGCATPYFVDPANGNVVNNGAFIGQPITLAINDGASTGLTGSFPGPSLDFYPMDIPANPPTRSCPSNNPPCNQLGNWSYYDNVACFNPTQFACGQTVALEPTIGGGFLPNRNHKATQCTIHGTSSYSGACTAGMQQDCFVPQGAGQPVLIQPGVNNPDPALASASYISRSDSVVTVPLFDGSNLCPGGSCTGSATVVGFLQLGIFDSAPGGSVQAIILNASGCNPGAGGPVVSGGGVTAIPVRLVQ